MQKEYFFYFPSVGKYGVVPSSVSRNEVVKAISNFGENKDQIFIVLESLTGEADKNNFSDILQKGSKEDLLIYLA